LTDLSLLTEAIRQESLDGWLFCNFAHRDRLTDQTLGLDPDAVSTRSWFYLLFANGDAVKVMHAMETGVLSSLPGTVRTYTGREELIDTLSGFSGQKFAVLHDPVLTVLSTMSGGHLSTIESCGIHTVSAAGVLQRVNLFKTDTDYDSHEKAAVILYRAVSGAWKHISDALHAGTRITEGTIRDYLLEFMAAEGLVTDHPPIVAAGANTANPHYSVPEEPPRTGGAIIGQDTLVQFDLWGKLPGGMYADISWVGYTGPRCPKEYQERFALVRDARDLVVSAVDDAFRTGTVITGAALDERVRAFLLSGTSRNRIIDPAWIRHRTGHAIDRECHGSGANLDSVEFPDSRPILEGSCFSVEPGIYCNDYGMRTEINVYIRHGIPVVSGLPIQHTILELQD